MKAYEINIKLNRFKPDTSRDMIIPENITFRELNEIFETSFGFDPFKTYSFSIPGLKLEIMDSKYSTSFQIYSEDTFIDNYFKYFKKINYTHNFSENWVFTIKIKKTVEIDFNYPKIIDYKGDYKLLEGFFGPSHLEDVIYYLKNPKELEDDNQYDFSILEEFDLNEANEELKKYYSEK